MEQQKYQCCRRLVFLIATFFICQVGQAARSRIPLNNVAEEADLFQDRRTLAEECEFIEQVQKNFCCDPEVTEECQTEREWFIDDEVEKAEQLVQQENAKDMNETVSAIVQWGTIGLCAICCPICIGVAICKCIIKRREKQAREEEYQARKEMNRQRDLMHAKDGYEMSPSSSSNHSDEDSEEREQRLARKQLAQQKRMEQNAAFNQRILDANSVRLQSMNQMMQQRNQASMGILQDMNAAENQPDSDASSNSRPSSSQSYVSGSGSEMSADQGAQSSTPNTRPPNMMGANGRNMSYDQRKQGEDENMSSFGGRSAYSKTNVDTQGQLSAKGATDLNDMQAYSGRAGTSMQHGRNQAADLDNSTSQYMATNMSLKSQDGLVRQQQANDALKKIQEKKYSADQLQLPNGRDGERLDSDDDLARDEIDQIRNFLNVDDDAEEQGTTSQLRVAQSVNNGKPAKIYPQDNKSDVGGKSVQNPLEGSQEDIL